LGRNTERWFTYLENRTVRHLLYKFVRRYSSQKVFFDRTEALMDLAAEMTSNNLTADIRTRDLWTVYALNSDFDQENADLSMIIRYYVRLHRQIKASN